jgi:putative ABC transport system permease protein
MTWWRRLISRDRLEDQLDTELRDHFERLVAEHRQQGHAEAEARRLARLEFGGLDQVKEACRDVRGTRWIEDAAQDVRHGVRGFLKTPGFTAVAVVTLALGIGANLAIFNVLDALLLRPLPVPNAQRLVTLTRWIENSSSESFSYPQIRALADRQDLFASLCGMGGATLFTGPPNALEPVGAALVSGKYFETLGVAPFMGRLLSAGDDQPGAAPVVVITHSYWLRRFAGDASIIGRTMLLEGQQVPIVGVTPPGFEGAIIGQRADVTAAIHAQAKLQPEDDGGTSADQRWLLVLAVPAQTLTRDQLQARLDVAWRQLLDATTPTRLSAEARRRALSMTLLVENGANGTSRLRGPMRLPLMVAYALVTLVLLIACVNVANLLLARGAARAREIALRLAIGASRGRILRQLLVESAMLAAAGTAVGVWIAWFGSDAIADVMVARAAGPDASEAALSVAPNARVFGVTALIAAATTLIFGIVPAWRASVTSPGVANVGRVAESHGRLASALIVAQVSLSLILVIGAGLFTRTLYNLRTVERGFTPGNVLLASFDPRRAGLSSPELQAFNQSVLRIVETLPGVGAASLAAVTPLQGGGMSTPMTVNGVSTGQAEVYFNIIAPRFFEIAGTPLLAGRDLTEADDGNAPAVTVVNEAFVRQHLSGGNPLGQRVLISPGRPEMQIVGVVKDAVYETLRAAPPATVYASYLQTRGQPMTLVIDADAPLTEVAATVRAAIQPKMPATPMRIRTFASQIENSLFQARLMRSLTAIFGALALLLAAVGLYGLMSYMVTTRTHEIGVRLALGARPALVMRMVLGNAIRMVVIGIIAGLPLALLASRLIASMVFGLTPTDAATIAAAVAVLTLVGAASAALPARRAATLNPVTAIHVE